MNRNAATNEELKRVRRLALQQGRMFSRRRSIFDIHLDSQDVCGGRSGGNNNDDDEYVYAATAKKRLPKIRPGYTLTCKRYEDLTCNVRVDPRALISLALIDRHKSSFLRAYASKTALMCINVSRLIYTTDAFTYRNLNDDCVTDALEFYIGSDIDRLDQSRPANRRFSDLLHSLKTTGYEDYIFRLADRLELDVDLVKNGFLYRYVRNYIQEEPMSSSSSSFSSSACGNSSSAGSGYCRQKNSYGGLPLTVNTTTTRSGGGGSSRYYDFVDPRVRAAVGYKTSENIIRTFSDVQLTTTSKSQGIITAVVTNNDNSGKKTNQNRYYYTTIEGYEQVGQDDEDDDDEGDWFVRTSQSPVVQIKTD